jgi:preprotein translocase subunit SecG
VVSRSFDVTFPVVVFPPVLAFAQELFGVLLAVIAVFLILLVLVQRGRGGGLAGALGGMGGSSAFGAKAGDVFTRITIVAAAIWILLCIMATRWGGDLGSRVNVNAPANSGSTAGAAATTDDDAASKEPGKADAKGAADAEVEPAEDAKMPATDEAKTDEAKADDGKDAALAKSPAAAEPPNPGDVPAADAPAADAGSETEEAESSAK